MITRFTLVYRNAGVRLQLSHIHNSYEYVPAGETPSLKLDLNTLKFVRSLILKQHSGKRIAVRSGNQTIFVDPYTVLYVQSQNKRTELVCADQDRTHLASGGGDGAGGRAGDLSCDIRIYGDPWDGSDLAERRGDGVRKEAVTWR